MSCEGIFCVRDALQELEPASKTRVLYQKKESKESQESIDRYAMNDNDNIIYYNHMRNSSRSSSTDRTHLV